MKNEKINATIQLDKLVLCCNSTVEDNFNDIIISYPDEALVQSHSFGKTCLTQSIDSKRRFKFCYKLSYMKYHIGTVTFGMFGQPHRDKQIWLSLSNQVFYNGILHYLPNILSDLNLEINNITRMEIALDCYNFNFEQILRRNIKNKDNQVKLLGKCVDRTARSSKIRYWNYGTLDNPFQVRTLYIQNQRLLNYTKTGEESNKTKTTKKSETKKTTFGLIAYNKLEEIKDFSPHKTYILDYHKAHNSKYKHIYRLEVRFESEELRRYVKKHRKPIELSDLLNKEFLFNMFTEYMNRIVVIKNCKKQKIQLFPTPFFGSVEGRLPLPLPGTTNKPQPNENKEIDYDDFQEKTINKKDMLKKELINRFLINQLKTITNENEKTIRRDKEENQSSHVRIQQSEFWETSIPCP